jgi:predicted transcriptional regulator
MSCRLSVRLSDEFAAAIDARARRSGTTKSQVVRDALATAGLSRRPGDHELPELLRRASALRARQPHFIDAAALVREGRPALRLTLKRLNVPIV